jgi:hypothetical protein
MASRRWDMERAPEARSFQNYASTERLHATFAYTGSLLALSTNEPANDRLKLGLLTENIEWMIELTLGEEASLHGLQSECGKMTSLDPRVFSRTSPGWAREHIYSWILDQVDLLARDEVLAEWEIDEAFERVHRRFLEYMDALGFVAVWDAAAGRIVVMGRSGKSDHQCWSLVDEFIETAVMEVTQGVSRERQRRRLAIGSLYEYEEDGPTFRFDLWNESESDFRIVRAFERPGVSNYRILRIMQCSLYYSRERLRIVMLFHGNAWDVTHVFVKICQDMKPGPYRESTLITNAEDIKERLNYCNFLPQDSAELRNLN